MGYTKSGLTQNRTVGVAAPAKTIVDKPWKDYSTLSEVN